MKRMELMANKSAEEEIISALEAGIHNFYSCRGGLIPKNPPFGGGALGRL
jgi:hypothetical protein